MKDATMRYKCLVSEYKKHMQRNLQKHRERRNDNARTHGENIVAQLQVILGVNLRISP